MKANKTGPRQPKRTAARTCLLSGEPVSVEEPAFFNEDCIEGARRRIASGSIDLILTDPPYGIEGDTLHKHYNRKERFVIDGYIEVPRSQYADFTRQWIGEAERILRPGGALYVVSGYTNLRDILAALAETSLEEVNHIIWKYNFGVHTRRKFVSSHYHLLYYEKPGGRRVFDRFARYGGSERDERGGSRQYRDMEDVWTINREYQPGRVKNKNQLPTALLAKILQYSSRPGDIVCDLFLGSFAVARVAKEMNRIAVGFERNEKAFERQVSEVRKVEPGSLLGRLKVGREDRPRNQGKPWPEEELDRLAERFRELRAEGRGKGEAVRALAGEFGRGPFAILNALKKRGL